MWSKNKTSEWIAELDEEKRKIFMDDARRNYPTLKKKFNERKTNLKMKRMEVVLKKQNDLKEKKMKADMKKVEAKL